MSTQNELLALGFLSGVLLERGLRPSTVGTPTESAPYLRVDLPIGGCVRITVARDEEPF